MLRSKEQKVWNNTIYYRNKNGVSQISIILINVKLQLTTHDLEANSTPLILDQPYRPLFNSLPLNILWKDSYDSDSVVISDQLQPALKLQIHFRVRSKVPNDQLQSLLQARLSSPF